MEAWGTGPFDNEHARDLVAALEAAGPSGAREVLIGGLVPVVRASPDTGLTVRDAARAVAAAATVANSRSVGETADRELAGLASDALDRVLLAGGNDWLAFWRAQGSAADAIRGLRPSHNTLTGARRARAMWEPDSADRGYPVIPTRTPSARTPPAGTPAHDTDRDRH